MTCQKKYYNLYFDLLILISNFNLPLNSDIKKDINKITQLQKNDLMDIHKLKNYIGSEYRIFLKFFNQAQLEKNDLMDIHVYLISKDKLIG
ncbi:hypothetical protein BpHYR1_048109 [Brachionus plicatilis]|uniref:Uncharacterized protein n=1 Tax=Brachionus plicatilis TaxID=10195 RepID=A0A3M7RFR9_BRAPC|nr:hypothetical protein BpHYR1_048109 [Brachionus plicatilis]